MKGHQTDLCQLVKAVRKVATRRDSEMEKSDAVRRCHVPHVFGLPAQMEASLPEEKRQEGLGTLLY